MRSTIGWRNTLTKQLNQHWPAGMTLKSGTFCEIELGLFVMEQLLPHEPVHSLWTILTGYPYQAMKRANWSIEQQRAVRIVRHLLPFYRSRFPWQRALERYQTVDSQLRGYDLNVGFTTLTRRSVSIAAKRWHWYEQALKQPPTHRRMPLQWATAGTYIFGDGRKRATVTIPTDFPLPPMPPTHQGVATKTGEPFRVTLEQLHKTAEWMDATLGQTEAQHWQQRIRRVQLEMFNQPRTQLLATQALTLDGMTHLVGMVSAGKSTLMDVVAVFAARHGYHITIVVGDVINALQRADLFTKLGLGAAPILGSSNRERHLARLHRAQHNQDIDASHHQGFRWLSTVCLLDGLRDTQQPLKLNQRPCLRLYQPQDDDEPESKPQACSFFSVCAYHQAQRDLLDAVIWIATPASLIYTQVAPQLLREQMRFAELVNHRSDLVIIDEADRVQIQLDSIFSPSQNLVSRTDDAWLSRLAQHITQQISREGRGQFSDPQAVAWCQAHDLVQLAANKVYALLLQSLPLQRMIERDYFTAWMILEQLAQTLSKQRPTAEQQQTAYHALMSLFEQCVDDPLGEQVNHPLSDIVRRSLTATNLEPIKAELATWVLEQCHTPQKSATINKLAEIFEFALSVAVLANRLDVVIREWKHVEVLFELEGAGSSLFHRPPDDYAAEIPAAPMGNVLAFQYLRHGDTPHEPGILRFFRCMGVGRWILLNFKTAFTFNESPGPHVLLLSATSWAGTAPGFDVQIPVDGILSAPNEELEAIQRSRFEYRPILNKLGTPIRISGLKGHERIQALDTMLNQLANRSRLGGPSPLERIRNELPSKRQRLLLLVGSYEEALHTRQYLDQLRADWKGQIVHLVADDTTLDSDWGSLQGLQRGMVHNLAQTEAWILVAPLLAIERGHNILNEDSQAAIGAAFFLLRPHPRPDDLSFAINSINRWAITTIQHPSPESSQTSLEAEALEFRAKALQTWRRLLQLPMIYSTLPEREHQAVTWNQMVTIWQVIGRLVRGGVEARVFFCDAAFAPLSTAESLKHTRSTSLLLSMLDILHPYFTDKTDSPTNKALAQRLYYPLYHALLTMEGIDHGCSDDSAARISL